MAKKPASVPATDAPIQSVERAARLLSAFTPARPRLTLAEITDWLAVSKPTAHRYAMALRKLNLLRYDPGSGEYTLGPQILTLASAARAGMPIISLAGPVMERLVEEVNETVVLSVWDGEGPVVVRVNDDTDRVVRVVVRVGARLSATDSAQGRVFTAYSPPEQEPDASADSALPREVRDELTAIREHRIAVSSPRVHGVRTLAAPIFGDGRIVAVLALVGTTATISDDVSSFAAKKLRRAAEFLSEQFGRQEIAPEEVPEGLS